MASLPKEMKALRYTKPEEYGIVKVPLPKVRDNDVLIKVKACGVCGTDLHIHEGEFIAKVRGKGSSFYASGTAGTLWVIRSLILPIHADPTSPVSVPSYSR